MPSSLMHCRHGRRMVWIAQMWRRVSKRRSRGCAVPGTASGAPPLRACARVLIYNPPPSPFDSLPLAHFLLFSHTHTHTRRRGRQEDPDTGGGTRRVSLREDRERERRATRDSFLSPAGPRSLLGLPPPPPGAVPSAQRLHRPSSPRPRPIAGRQHSVPHFSRPIFLFLPSLPKQVLAVQD